MKLKVLMVTQWSRLFTENSGQQGKSIDVYLTEGSGSRLLQGYRASFLSHHAALMGQGIFDVSCRIFGL